MRVPSIRRSLATASILAVTAGSLAACGDDASGKADAGSTTTKTSASSTGTGNASAPLDKAEFVKAITTGQVKAGSAHVDVALAGSLKMHAKGDVDYGGGQPSLRMTMDLAQLANKQIELRLVDGIVYVKIPRLTPAGKFVRIDPKDKSNPMSKSFGSLSDQADPLKGFQALKSSVRTVRYVGKQDIGGTATKHYKVTVDGAALLKATKQRSVPQMPKTVTYDMWLDQKNLLRRATFDLAGLSTVVNVTDWGKKVDVSAPPKSAQVDASSLSGAGVRS